MYLLVFDRSLADKAVAEKYPSEGPHFLEKIIQAGFELPAPLKSDLNKAILASVEEICGPINESQIRRIMNNFYDVVVPYITTPRHVVRFRNAISVTWPAIANDVSLADFIALEALRLYEPKLFQAIRVNKTRVCGVRQRDGRDSKEDARFNRFITGIDEQRHDTVKLALQRLFPRLELLSYESEFIHEWDAERRVCVEKHFDTYFRLSLGEETLSTALISELIDRADDRDFVQSVMREATRVTRKNGSSMIPVYLDALTTHAPRIQKQKVKPLIIALSEIHDEIDLDCDRERGFGGIANTTLRFHWLIRRLTADRFSIDERTDLYIEATRVSQLGWLVDFTASAKSHYRGGSKRQEKDCLITETAIPQLIEQALTSIRAAAENTSLLYHPDLINILYRWRDFLGDSSAAVRAWTDSLMQNEKALVTLADRLTRESWSLNISMFNLPSDRVSIPTIQVQIDDDIEILDAQAFRRGLERIRDEEKLDEGSIATVTTFLEAWDHRKEEQQNL